MMVYYFIGFAGGIFLGWLQFRFLFGILKNQGWRRYLLLIAKLALWGASMVLLAMWSIPVLLMFAVGATLSMLGAAIWAHRQKKEV